MALIVATMDETVETPKQLTLGMEVPVLDENCLALGYSTMSIGQEGFVDLKGRATVHVSSSRGRIEEVHPSFRDNFKVTFPSFRTDARYHVCTDARIYDSECPTRSTGDNLEYCASTLRKSQ